MDKNELDILFKSGFDAKEWKNVLSQVFKATELRTEPEFVDSLSQSTGANVWYLGEKTSETDYTVGYFVFEITSGTVVHKRVGLRNLTKAIVNSQYGVYDSVVAVFYDKEHWRCSFISDIRGDKTAPRRYSFVFGDKEQGYNTAVNRFFALQNTEAKYADIKDAFSVEALSDEFFNKYKTLYANFIQYITGKRYVKVGSKWEEKQQHEPNATLYAAFGNDDKRIRDYVKKLMGRITFLYFVQKKGWFNKDYNYLQHLFENSKYQNDFLDRVLEPFFYTVLNTEDGNRQKAFDDHNKNLKPSEVEWNPDLLKDWKYFPFLNGGLFERDENDIVRSQFPPQFFENLNCYDENFVGKIPQKDYPWDNIPGIFDLFAQYNFTIDENDPNDAEVGIDPEMLGKIFENLLEDNKDKGAFYTPKEIVQYMCRESLIAYLQTDAKDEAHKERLRKFVTTHDASILENPEYVRRKIRDIKVCDPAIGSGAFPMGMLDQLVACSEALDMHINHCSDRSEIKKHIIQNSIYGVDIERGAVDIARLRFWLSLVIDEADAVPLPNLDYKIMQGNSLLEQYEGIDLSKLQVQVNQTKVIEPQKDLFGRITDGQLKMTFTQETTVNNLQGLLNDYFYETNHREKAKLKQKITKIVNDHILYNIELRKNQVNRFIGEDEVLIRTQENKIADLQTQFPNQKLSPSLTAKFDAEIQKARRRIADNEAQLQKYDNALTEMLQEDFLSSNQQFFLWHTWFADVFNRSSNQGFDVVIGNPPYGAKITNDEKDIYEHTYVTAKTIKGIQKGSLDTFTLFIEHGYNIIKSKGTLAYIVPISITSSEASTGVHNLLFENCKEISISSYAVRPEPVFKNAVVNTSIIMFTKTLSKCEKLLSTKMYRKKGNDFSLKQLVNNLKFVNVKGLELMGRIPKIGSDIEKHILMKIKGFKTLNCFLESNGKPIFYRTSGGRYFKVVTNYPTGSTKEKPIFFKKDFADAIGCILSSSLSFWFYQIYSNNLDWKSYEIENFTIPDLTEKDIDYLNDIYERYLSDIEDNANVRVTTEKSKYLVQNFKEYKIVRSKSIIDGIDDYICPLYGLTKEETEFIKNYELEFRMSGE